MYTMDDIQAVDPEIAAAIQEEFDRQNSHIELIASENWVSPAVMSAMGSILTSAKNAYQKKRFLRNPPCIVLCLPLIGPHYSKSQHIHNSKVDQCLGPTVKYHTTLPSHFPYASRYISAGIPHRPHFCTCLCLLHQRSSRHPFRCRTLSSLQY